MHRPTRSLGLLVSLALLTSSLAFAQQEIPHRYEEWNLDSGFVRNQAESKAVIWTQTIEVEGAAWIRLFFSDAELGQLAGRGDGSVLRITSLEDFAVQTLDARNLEAWRHSSAFFNGPAVRIEIVADPAAPASRVAVHEVMVGEPGGGPESICGATDDRTLSSDARNARIVPVGCTGWLIDDAQGCFLTAGHCASGGSLQVVEFDVPLSDADGSVNHPGPDKQYPVDLGSIQFTDGGIGNDWAYFGAFPNSQTQKTPLEAQGDTYVLGTPPVTPGGEMIRITGYGTTTGTQGTPLTWSQVQTTHVGPLAGVSSSSLQYATDTTGGDSGSPVINDGTGEAIGIHTHAGCSAGGGANNGTNITLAAVQNALSNPVGICTDGVRPLQVFLDTPLADPLSPTGSTIRVQVLGRNGLPAAADSATLVFDQGTGDQTVAMVDQGSGVWQGNFPALTCGSEATIRVDTQIGGVIVRHPYAPDAAADRRYRRWIATGFDVAFRDTFETDQGWTVEDDPGLTAGSWERALPAGYGFRQDPPWDADTVGDGRAFLTDAAGGNTDVDGGATRLVSPVLDASAGDDPHVSYWRWWDDGGPGAPSDDTFLVEISNDGGSSWTTLEEIGPGVDGAWVRQTFRVADFVTPNDQLRLRFTAGDLGAGDIIEAAVDGVVVSQTGTPTICDEIFSDGFESGDTTLWSNTIP